MRVEWQVSPDSLPSPSVCCIWPWPAPHDATGYKTDQMMDGCKINVVEKKKTNMPGADATWHDAPFPLGVSSNKENQAEEQPLSPQDHVKYSKTVACNYLLKWWQRVNFPSLFLALSQAAFVSESRQEAAARLREWLFSLGWLHIYYTSRNPGPGRVADAGCVCRLLPWRSEQMIGEKPSSHGPRASSRPPTSQSQYLTLGSGGWLLCCAT